jgi:hypothetical protein
MKRHQIDFPPEIHYRQGLSKKQRQRLLEATDKLNEQ